MTDAYVRTLGTLTDVDGVPVAVGVDYDTVTIRTGGSLVRLSLDVAAMLALVFGAAQRVAEANAAALLAEEDTL